MESLFQTIGYLIFGNKWVLWSMKNGYKTAIFVNEIEIEMQKEKMSMASKTRREAEKELATLEATPLKDAMLELPEEERTNSKAIFDMETKIKEERAQAIHGLQNQIKSLKQEEELGDGELARVYSIAYGNRRKYDFVKNYNIKPTYADLNK